MNASNPTPANLYRARAIAMSVPSTVAMSVEMPAILRLSHSASVRASSLNGSPQLSSVNSCQMKLNRPTGLLNE